MNWDVGFIVTLLGTFIGIISLILFFRYRAKPRLVYLINSIISPIKIVKNIGDINIQYKNKPITENLFLLNVTIINAGNVDIDKSGVYKNLSIVLPEYFNWLNINIAKKSKEMEVGFKNDSNILSFDWDLLKPKEFFTIESLIEYNGEDVLNAKKKLLRFTWDYRIKDLSTIEAFDKNRSMGVPGFITAVILILLIGFGGYQGSVKSYSPRNETKFSLILSDRSVREIDGLYFKSLENNIIMQNDNRKDLDTLQYKDSTVAISIKPSLVKKDVSYPLVILGLLISLVSFVGLLFLTKLFVNNFRVKKIFDKLIKEGGIL